MKILDDYQKPMLQILTKKNHIKNCGIDLEKNTLFPLFHINPVNVTVGLHQRTFNFQLFLMDLVEPDSSNEQEVLSDCLEIMNDIIAIYKHGEILYKFNDEAGEEDRYFINDDFTIEPFTITCT